LKRTRGVDAETAAGIDRIVEEGLAEGQMAGAVVVAATSTEILFADAYGHRQLEPQPKPMKLDTLFDLASITKPLATACSVMKLVELGEVDLDAPVARYLPEFAPRDKDAVTVTDLLLHQGGLIPDNALSDYEDGPDEAWKRICALKLTQPPGESFVYTDVGFIVLGKLVERVSGQRLDRFAAERLFEPLGMDETGFKPPPELARRAAATERRDGQWMVGEVHDPRAFRLDGIAGHAGLFSTAGDLITFGRMLLGEGVERGTRVLAAETVREMRKPRKISRGRRALGWDVRSPYSSNRGETFSQAAFGHGGFTGTVFWIDPERDLVFVFLSNRLHPDGEGRVNRLAGRIATLLGEHPRHGGGTGQ
jgi:CubicO group peptidase (beta-lactamase class C family)